jgi:hypothetical protein
MILGAIGWLRDGCAHALSLLLPRRAAEQPEVRAAQVWDARMVELLDPNPSRQAWADATETRSPQGDCFGCSHGTVNIWFLHYERSE